MSRSEFFARAATCYLDELDRESVTHQINQAVSSLEMVEESAAAVNLGRQMLAGTNDDL